MEPRIQYAKTSDGVNIAYATAGKGRTVIMASAPPISHVQRLPEVFPGSFEGLVERFHAVWYDSRGCGLSDREPLDFSTEAMMGDLAAVIEESGVRHFCLTGTFDGAAIAVTYAALHPEQVSQLVVVDGWFEYSDYYLNPAMQAEGALRAGDWNLYTETLAKVLWGLEDPNHAALLAEFLRSCVEPAALRVAWSHTPNGIGSWHILPLLPQVVSPTLVLHNKNNRFLRVESGRRLAAGIRGARFLEIDDMAYTQLPRLIDDFLSETNASESAAPAAPPGTAVILFADIADSTGMTERMGDAAFREKARELDGALRSAVRERGGTAIEGKLLGDGVLAVFTSAREAIEAALACRKAGDDAGLPLHLGIHAGDVIREDNNVYGGAVNIASRIAGASAAGEVLVSETVRSLARTSAGVGFEDRGEQELKGVGEPVRVWAVQRRE